MIIVCEKLLVKVGRKNMKRPPTGQMSVERESSVNNDLTWFSLHVCQSQWENLLASCPPEVF